MSIKMKILVPMILLTIVVSPAILISNVLLFNGFIDDVTVDNVNTASAVTLNNIDIMKGEAQNASL